MLLVLRLVIDVPNTVPASQAMLAIMLGRYDGDQDA